MTITAPALPDQSLHQRLQQLWETPPGLRGVLTTVDHKRIGRRYLITAFVFMLLGGLEAALIRAQLALPDRRLVSPEVYNQLFSMHGITMIFLYASPVLSGFSNYIWPLMLGSRDMAFPRLNALSYWVFLISGIFLYSSFLVGQAPDRGWFAYAPLTDVAYSPGLNMDFYALGLLLLTISSTVGAINFIVTLFRLRAPGMTINRLPIFIWGTLTTSFSMLFALPALTVACVFLFLERRFGMHFFDAAAGGQPLLWQHLFWIFGHPWVYIVVLPAMGIMSDLIPTFCRRPLVGYTWVALSTVATGIIGFGVWVHHMFSTGLPPVSMDFFSAASLIISIPSAVAVFAWVATVWEGRPVLRTPFLFAAGFIVLFVMGGASGVVTAVIPFDWQVTDSYFVVGHLHYVLVGINVFPVIAGLYFWLPKITGRMLSERLGRWNFWVMFLGFNLGFFPMHIAGLLGMPRRIYTYSAGLGWDTVNLITTIGAYIFAIGVMLFLVNLWWSLRRGAKAGNNPWDAATLEWATESPPWDYNFARLPSVASRHPLWENDLREGQGRSSIDRGPELAEGRETLGVTPVDAVPNEVLTMPEDSPAPLLVAIGLLALAYGLVASVWPLAIAGGLGTVLMAIVWLWPPHQAPEVAA